jgi:hypothetical protein
LHVEIFLRHFDVTAEYRMTYSASSVEITERSDIPVSMKVVAHVATVTDQEVTQLPPLYDRIDPEALDAVVDSAAKRQSQLTIRFTYAGQQVTVNADGAVSISENDK